jgi:AcrR family transcriptional regulator
MTESDVSTGMSSMGAVQASSRRTQAERTAAMRDSLADAAIEVLIERGWAAVTVIEVCNRAGVTRGAFHHHYDSLPELLADALRRVYASMSTVKARNVTDLAGLIDSTWRAMADPSFKAVLEAWLAMANDPALRSEIGPVVAEFATFVNPHGKAPSILVDEVHRDYYLMARESLLGLALGRATSGGHALGHEKRVLKTLRAGASALDRTPD